MEIRDRVQELRRIRAGDLIPNEKNWRRHPKAQQAALAGLLQEIGYADALLARETPEGLVLIDGHLRAETTPDTVVPVLILDVDEAEADKLLLTLDPLASLAQADRTQLKELLDNVQTESKDVQRMLENLALDNRVAVPGAEGLTDPDAAPPLPKVPRTKPGHLWILGDHRLLCGDSTSQADVARLFEGGEEASLMATDPPYLVDYDGASAARPLGRVSRRRGLQDGENSKHWDDYVDPATSLAFFADFLRLGCDHLKPHSAIYQWHASRRQGIVEEAWLANRLHLHQTIIWVKPRGVLTRADYMWKHEPAFFGWVDGFEPCFYGWFKDKRPEKDNRPPAYATTVWMIGGENDGIHPTQKPVELMAKPIEYHTNPGDVVYEPFSGSGTQIIAAEKLGRRCFAMELAPAYVDVAVARWEAFTGREAVQMSGSSQVL